MKAIGDVQPRFLNPYLYYDREVEVYMRIMAKDKDLLYRIVPRVVNVVDITRDHEKELLLTHMRSYKPDRYRGQLGLSQESLSLKGLLMEYVEGERLSREDVQQDPSLRDKFLRSLAILHSCDVCWGDVKWRNIIRRTSYKQQNNHAGASSQLSEGTSLVLLDFSNSQILQDESLKSAPDALGGIFVSRERMQDIHQQEISAANKMMAPRFRHDDVEGS